MFYFLGPVRAGHVFHVLVLSVGVYTREALTGFDEEPVVTSCIPAVIPTAAYDQQTVNMIDDPNVVFKQPGACQHHIGTKEAITTTPATDSNVQTASFPKSNTSPFSDDYALAVEDPVSNSIQMLDLIHKNS
ncbi:hypothetical protein BDF19DRAFT_449940 [Syncephalis fuscata]|nr:hypothetical protein BDF19DRAFT_449940 [Syncephalis fuscata]